MNNFTNALEIFRQTGDICAYLNISISKQDSDLNNKFSALDNVRNRSLFDSLFPGIGHQIIVAKCAFDLQLAFQSKIPNIFPSYAFQQLIIPGIFAFLSIILNLSLVIVTVKKIPFIKICNFLILFDSFCQIPFVLPFLINFIAFLLGNSFIDFHICLFVLMLSTGCSFASFMAIFLISLERLLNLIFPIRMHSISLPTIKKYSILAFAICLLFGFCMILTTFNILTIINLTFNKSLLCNSGFYADVLNIKVSYILLLSSIANYCIIFGNLLWHHIWRKRKITNSIGTNAAGAENKKLAKSMTKRTSRMLLSVFFISVVIFIGCLLASALRNQILVFITIFLNKIFMTKTDNTLLNNMANIIVGLVICLSIIAAGINAPILIITSSEYRKAYKDTFCIRIRRKPNSIGPLFAIQQQ